MGATLSEQQATVGEPAWAVAQLFPNQGHWSKWDYFHLSDLTNRPIELADGQLEVLPMRSTLHQLILAYLYRALYAFVTDNQLGTVLFAALPVELWPDRFREPDILFMRAVHAHRMKKEYWEGADLVVEIVSDSNRRHDLVRKRAEYAQAGIPEYWIVDPTDQKLLVLTLPAGSAEYAVHGEWAPGQQATSVLLPGFVVDVAAAVRREV